ncbi:outer dynein arm-docking complex subunit 4 [Phymastichus coffea]|uniref:outer dynein arm-docking complex subunit 4 n=1 Tax=Phymastichus coffea TaxID=108790 RepID=UPI00273C2918|nr:outer dynein arm-docking complex subunit 4 [Phymastichus coffea]
MSSQEPELFLAQVLYREWGRRFTTCGQYLKGIHYYEKSSTFGDENYLWTLLGLSVALKRSGQFARAAEIAEKCMKLDSKHLGANWTRMEALFDIGEFCMSLVYAHQGARRRRSYQAAVLLANETIEDCLGDNLPRDMFVQLHPWIAKLTEHRKNMREKLKEEENEFEGLEEEQARFKASVPEAYVRRQLRRHDQAMASFYLGATAADKSFLEELPKHRALRSANKRGSALLSAAAKDCTRRVHSQQEALRSRKPLYAVRAIARMGLSEGHKLKLQQELQFRACLAKNEATFILRKLHSARKRRNYFLFFQVVERAREKFEAYSLQLLPDRGRYLDALYRMVARAYLDPRDLRCIRHPSQENVYFRVILGLRGKLKLPRDSQICWLRFQDGPRAFDIYRTRLALARRPLEILWIFHELCRLYLQVRRYEMARFYSKKLRDLSLEVNQEDYALNAQHIMLRIEVAQGNRTEAQEAAAEALELATKLQVDHLVEFYERAAVFIEKMDFSHVTDEDSIATRRNLISALMSVEMKPKMDLLLRGMEAVPAKRRLSVMPGCKPRDSKPRVAFKATVQSKGPPNVERDAEVALLEKYAPSKRIPGLVDFTVYD